MNKTKQRQYARLIARKGANIQKKQPVIINAQVDQYEFVNILVDECYKAGASEVVINWGYQPLTKLAVRYKSEKLLSTIHDWEIARLKHMAEVLPAVIHIESSDPDGLAGINQKKYAKAMQKIRTVTKPITDSMDNKHQWCIAAVPGEAWAKKLFPGVRKSVAVEMLWNAILEASRAKGDAIANWDEHNADLKSRCDYLNALNLKKLHYTSSNGTDFTVGLLDKVKFHAGADDTISGVTYNPNIPSEEVFTSPDKNCADGVVVSTKPLSYQGQIIDNFKIWFEKGKAVKVYAEKNQTLLEEMIKMDECACMLGECALVPYDSPIRNSGILFYSTLFDENAACHLALGAGFNECLEGFEKMTDEECTAYGINDSIIHVDFMIGSEDLDIVGIDANGKEIQIFKNGNWAF